MANLADLIVEFTTKGADALEKSLDQISEKAQVVQQSLESINDSQIKKAAAATVALRRDQERLNLALKKAELIAEKGAVFGRLSFLAARLAPQIRALNVAFLGATAGILGFAVAGFRASGIGQQFSFHMERLSRVIGGLFKPEMEAIVDLVERLTSKLESMTDAQRASLAMWLKFAVALKLVSFFASSVLSTLNPLLRVLLLIGSAFTLANASSGEFSSTMRELASSVGSIISAIGEVLKPILDVLGVIFKALAPIIAGIFRAIAEVLRNIAAIVKGIVDAVVQLIKIITFGLIDLSKKKDKAKKEAEDRSELTKKAGGFEAIESTFERFAKASVNISPTAKKDSIPERQLEKLDGILTEIKKLGDNSMAIARGRAGGRP